MRHSVVFLVHSKVVEMQPRVCTAPFTGGCGTAAVDVSAVVVAAVAKALIVREHFCRRRCKTGLA